LNVAKIFDYKSIGIIGYGTKFRGIGGRLKQRPEDFVVAEILKQDSRSIVRRRGTGYPLYVMSKRNTDVLTAKKVIEQSLGFRINLLGLKDKRAVTHQFVSSRTKASPRSNYYSSSVKCVHIVDTARPLTRRDLLANSFDVKITGCTLDNEAFHSITDALMNLEIPNFFGVQRFGSLHPNHLIGRLIVKRKFKEAASMLSASNEEPLTVLRRVPLRLRRLYISAYQSFLFNKCLSRLLLNGGLPKTTHNEVLMRFRKDVPWVDETIVTRMQSSSSPDYAFVQMCPMPGYSFRSRDNDYWKAMEDVLREEGVRPSDFFVKDLQEVSAEGGLRAASMVGWIRKCDLDNESRMKFILYKGEYATILLRELMKSETTNQT
jgi:tRNA pseudouridine13 synthase